jgi:type IV pilus assembly protein PilW
MQNAGYGLPVYRDDVTPFKCATTTDVDHDGDSATARIQISPVAIANGNGVNASDTLSIRYGDSMKGGIGMLVIGNNVADPKTVWVENNMGCDLDDSALLIRVNGTCVGARVTLQPIVGVIPSEIKLSMAGANPAIGDTLSCIGRWSEMVYNVDNNNQLTRSGQAIVSDIVNMQLQYGISATPNSNQVTKWVDATNGAEGDFANPSIDNRNRIKAIRIAVVARNGLLATSDVTTPCSSLIDANPTGLCAWAGSSTSPAPAIDLTANANWKRYRYRVYETIMPMKSILWSRRSL